jgi:hypothetical protein
MFRQAICGSWIIIQRKEKKWKTTTSNCRPVFAAYAKRDMEGIKKVMHKGITSTILNQSLCTPGI